MLFTWGLFCTVSCSLLLEKIISKIGTAIDRNEYDVTVLSDLQDGVRVRVDAHTICPTRR